MKRHVIFLLTLILWTMPGRATPALWQVSDDDTVIHIFGTLHLLEKGTTWASASVTNAFANSDALIVELDDKQMGRAGPLFAEAGKLPLGMHMRDLVGNGIYNDVQRLTKQLDLPADTFANARPWFTGMSLTVIALTKAGYDPASGVDRTLIEEAIRLKKPILGIETAAQQANLFASLTPAQDKAMLIDALRQAQNVKSQMEEMQSAWMEADLETLDQILNGQLDMAEGLGDHLLYDRNRSWAAQMMALLSKPGRFFVAVGTAHLVGEKSLITILHQAGVSVLREQ